MTHTRFSLAAAALSGLIALLPAPPTEAAIAGADARQVEVRPGDTLMQLLERAGVAAGDAHEAVASLRPLWDPRALQVGQEISLGFDDRGLSELRLAPNLEEDVVVRRDGDGHFASHAEARILNRVPELLGGTIRTSLFDAADHADVPPAALAEMIRAFSYDVDFQRDVQPGDGFEVLFDQLYDENGKAVGTSDIIYAAMTLSGKTMRLYRYAPAGEAPGFYNAHGESVRKALLRTPVDGARISSRFGLRHHPILGYTAMHRGIDFAVPKGTPIMAAGDGVVVTEGRERGYGKLVILRHRNGYETVYAHMSRFARGVKHGTHVHQGEVIGYVGATGRATGPHLHYEIRVHGKAVNPLGVKMPSHQRLTGRTLAAFLAMTRSIDHRLLVLRQDAILAAAPGQPDD
jgi:murein DD-endopeptidase MepM/ murein hydrolase activator NlpD